MSKTYKAPAKKTTSLKDRDAAYMETYQRTKNKRAAVRAYCRGNKWLTENAKAVGNW